MIIEYSESNQAQPIAIRNSTFSTCQSQYNGGALSLIDVREILIEDTNFESNNAQQSGGAIFHSCNQSQTISYPCRLNITSTKFIGNFAGIEGGAIKWNFFEPLIDHHSVSFERNKAIVYGDDIASVAVNLVQIMAGDIEKKYYDSSSHRFLSQSIAN